MQLFAARHTAAFLVLAGCASAQSWEYEEEFLRPAYFLNGSIAMHEGTGRAVRFGGQGFYTGYDRRNYGDTWEFVDDRWIVRHPAHSPSPRGYHAMAYDYARGTVVSFLGDDRMGGDPRVWEWDGQDWSVVPYNTVAPPPRRGPAVASNPLTREIFVYGGLTGFVNVVEDAWIWNGSGWRSLGTFPLYGSAGLCTGAINPITGRPVVTGVDAPTPSFVNEFDGNGFRVLPRSPLRIRSMVSDPIRQRVLAYGFDIDGYPRAAAWDGSSWRSFGLGTQARSPGGLSSFLEPGGQSVILVGQGGVEGRGVRSVTGELWRHDLTNDTFTPIYAPVPKPTMETPAVVHLPGQDQFLLVGEPYAGHNTGLRAPRNSGATLETWTYSPERGYAQVLPNTSPPQRWYNFDLAHHASSGLTMLYGDRNWARMAPAAFRADDRTWVFDGNDWQGLQQSPRPDPDGRFSMVYDAHRDRIFVVAYLRNPRGGTGITQFWTWDPSGWTRLPDFPPIAGNIPLTYDPVAREVIGYFLGSLYRFDDTNGWTRIPNSFGPPNSNQYRRQPVFSYVPDLGGIVLAGGRPTGSNGPHEEDTWLWDGSSWTQLSQDSFWRGYIDGYTNGYAVDHERQRVLALNNLSNQNTADRPALFEHRALSFDHPERSIGDPFTIALDDPREANQWWFLGFSLDDTSTIPVKRSPFGRGVRIALPLAPDPLLQACFQFGLAGQLDAQGRGAITITLPNDPALEWTEIHAAAVTLSPNAVRTVTNEDSLLVLPR